MKRRSALLFLAILSTAAARRAASPIVVSDAWSRPAADTAVVYATIRNRGSVADRLLEASSPVATRAELHESFETKTPETKTPDAPMGATSMDAMPADAMPTGDAMMSMKPLSSIPIAARGTTALGPGGYHVMLDLRRPIKAGETIPLRLRFAHAGWIATTTTVR